MFYSIGRAIASLDGPNLLQEFADVADRIQRSLLTIDVPHVPGMEIGVRAAPARIVGGDYVDVVTRPDKTPIFAIGDVSGKSLPAALRAMTLRYLIRGLVSVLESDVAAIVTHANEVVCADIEPDSFVTFSLAEFSSDLRSIRLANAGHDPALILRAATRTIEQMDVGSLAMGIEADVKYREQSATLRPNDVIAFYTDGFTEARNPEGEQFTLAHVKDGLHEYQDLPAQALADALFQRIETYAAGTLNDDATILVIRTL